MKSRISDIGTVLGGMKVFGFRTMEIIVKRRLYEGIAVSTPLYVCG